MRVSSALFVNASALVISCAGLDSSSGPAAPSDTTAPAPDPASAVADGTIGKLRVKRHDGTVEWITYTVRGGRMMWHGDIDLGPARYGVYRSDAIKDLSNRWPNSTIGVLITPGSAAWMQAINDAIDEYALRTPLKFVDGGSANPNMLFLPRFTEDNVSNTTGIGPDSTDPGVSTDVNINWMTTSSPVVLHEMGHAIGFDHEQNRSDRDNHVDFDESCTTDPDQFEKSGSDFENIGTYDLTSIMHYRSAEFCAKFPLTILPENCICFPLVKKGTSNTLPPCTSTVTSDCTRGFISASDDLSNEDVRAVTRMYEPILGANEPSDSYGRTIVSGDFDNDGFTDLAVAAPEETPGNEPDATGAVLIYRGTGRGLVAWRVIRESNVFGRSANGDRFGAAMAVADFDGDGFDDLVVGAPFATASNGKPCGMVFVLYGGLGGPGARVVPGSHAVSFTATRLEQGNPETGDQFGAAIATGKLDGDSLPDLAIGAPNEARSGGPISGWVTTFTSNGSSRTFSNNGGIGAPSPTDGDRFGSALAIANFDDAGRGDLAVGAPGRGSGRVFVYTSNSSGFDAAIPIAQSASGADAPTGGDGFGTSLAVGNFDGATYSATGHKKHELVIGAPGKVNPSGSGRVFVVKPFVSSQLSFSQSQMIGQGSGNNLVGDRLGTVVIAADLDGDGFDDVVAGVPGKDSEASGSGGIVVYSGSSDGIGSAHFVTWILLPSAAGLESPATNDHAGSSLAVGKFHGASTTLDIAEGLPGRKSASGAVVNFVGTFFPVRYLDQETTFKD